MTTMSVPERCSNCGEYWPHFTWDYSLVGKSGIVDGRHCIGEITVNVFLGCDFCSETLVVVPLDDFLQHVQAAASTRIVRTSQTQKADQ